MPHCDILGDSLAAAGVANYRTKCRADTKVGITSGRYVMAHLMAVAADMALISLRVNDGPYPKPPPRTWSICEQASGPVASSGYFPPGPMPRVS